ncbi:peptidase M66 [Chania multitudinisentens RB-25]|uniref:Peptidase M66 n=2 Tax=Chania TaxID=1745211 RepID=W0LF44_9GAMM|nr:M66 family metalloprotease [Chania multitudinisentens]AHG20882.1 peptidase M66 [Chania multitudinisentens RB-25]
MRITKIASLMIATLATGPLSAEARTPLIFNTTTPQNDLTGAMAAQVQFAQSQILPAQPKEGDRQPTLTSLRKSLLLVRPLQADEVTPVRVQAQDANGKVLGTLTLAPPSALPETVYHLSDAPKEDVDFTPTNGSSVTISSSADLDKLSDKSASFLKERLTGKALVDIQTADGYWVQDIYLPAGAEWQDKMVRVRSNAGYSSNIYYGNKQVTVSRGQTLQFKSVNGQWFYQEELENNRITYAQNTWSGELPAEWILPGLSLTISQGKHSGELTRIRVGAPNELLLHTIDIGMLTPPRDRFDFAKDPEAHREYFQTIPVSRMIVSQYAPVHLQEVMLPDGTLLTDFDPSTGGWHTGTMREQIGKELISHGIDNANYGINNTATQGNKSYSFDAAQLVAHNSRGNYANGVQVHGGSGGAGIVTLDKSLGNEFSHEVGHNYGLGHYVDGFRGSVHRSADQINSSWGWDSDKRRFIPNFFPTRTNADACLDGECQPPFEGRKFGFDSMAGGSPFSNANRFTLYTPNSAAIIQSFLESKAVFDANSPTGFSKWDAATARMEPYEHKVEKLEQIDAPVDDLSENRLMTLFDEYSVVNIAMWDGHWTRYIRVPAASDKNQNRSLTINHKASYNSILTINGEDILIQKGVKKSFTSDGQRWQESAEIDTRVVRKPEQFGVPVTTLVGYYDPQGTLPSYIYPALHGAYGFTYSDDSTEIADGDCQLQVETDNGILHFKLTNHRAISTLMNKFHINVPTASQPSRATVLCHNQSFTERTLSSAPEGLSYTVNGRALPAKHNEGCIISNQTGDKYCLPIGERSGYSLPSWIYNHEVHVDAGSEAKVYLSDWDNLSYSRVGEFIGNVATSELKNVRAWNGMYLDFSKPKSMRVVSK